MSSNFVDIQNLAILCQKCFDFVTMDEAEDDDDDGKSFFGYRIPQRYVVPTLLFFVMAHNIAVRGVISIQLPFLLFPSNFSIKNLSRETIVCDYLPEVNVTTPPRFQGGNHNWTGKDIKDLKRSYFIFYVFCQPVVGFLSDRFIYAPRFFILFSLLASNVYCLLLQTIISFSRKSLWPLYCAQAFLGLGHSAHFPAAATILSHWVPRKRRAFICASTFSGIFLGVTLKHSSIAPVIHRSRSWPLPAYLFGCLGFIIVYGWYRYGYADPQHSKHISKLERHYLNEEMDEGIIRKNKPIPVKELLTNVNVWIIVMGNIGPAYFWNIIRSTIAAFLKRAYLLNRTDNSTWRALPYAISTFFPGMIGLLSDWIVNKGYTDAITLRKIFTNIGTMGPPIYIIALTYCGCNKELARGFGTMAMCFLGCTLVGVRLLPLDMDPNYSGFLYGMMGLCTASYFFVQELEDLLAPDRTLDQFRHLFWVCFTVAFFSNLCVIPLGYVKTSMWNMQQDSKFKKRS